MKTIKLLLSTLLLFILSFNVNAELSENTTPIAEHLKSLNYKVIVTSREMGNGIIAMPKNIIPKDNNKTINDSNVKKIILIKKDHSGLSDNGFFIMQMLPLKKDFIKNINFYKWINKLNNELPFVKVYSDNDYIIFKMDIFDGYQKESFTKKIYALNVLVKHAVSKIPTFIQ